MPYNWTTPLSNLSVKTIWVSSVFFFCVCLYVSVSPSYKPHINRLIMDGFQILRYLENHLDYLLQSINSKFSKIQKIIKKYPFKYPKIIFADLSYNFALFRAKIWLWLFYTYLLLRVLRIYTSHCDQNWRKTGHKGLWGPKGSLRPPYLFI